MKRFLIMLMTAALAMGLVSCSPGHDDSSASFTVAWNLNYEGAPYPETETVNEGAFLTAPDDPERTGFTFNGWYRESACETQWIFDEDTVTSDTVLYAKWQYRSYLTFKSSTGFSVSVSKPGWNGTLQYSKDTENWETFTGTEVNAQQAADGSFYLYFRGKDNTAITGKGTNRKWTISGTGVECLGNIMPLLDWEDPDSAVIADYCCNQMFSGCTELTAAPELPAVALASHCYNQMFKGCTGLTAAPVLPAATLADYCYNSMFYGCTGLTAAPALPAGTLADYCYSYMFDSCTGLTEAPVLPVKTLASHCYYQMFEDCTGLTAAPVLPAETLADSCYSGMFSGCTGLTEAPALPAKTLPKGCYHYMFEGCTGLTAAPSLPATTLANFCYMEMFESCTGLTSAPALPAETLADSCYREMFKGCTELKINSTATGTSFLTMPGTVPSYAVTDMFSGTGGSFTSDPAAGGTYYYE